VTGFVPMETRASESKCLAKCCPDHKHVSTRFVERQHLSMRISIRRFTRLTDALSKKVQNHAAAVMARRVHALGRIFGRKRQWRKPQTSLSFGII